MPAMMQATAGREPNMDMRARTMQQDYRFDADRWFAQFPEQRTVREADVARLVLASTPQAPLPAGANDRVWLRELLLDPVYQLK